MAGGRQVRCEIGGAAVYEKEQNKERRGDVHGGTTKKSCHRKLLARAPVKNFRERKTAVQQQLILVIRFFT